VGSLSHHTTLKNVEEVALFVDRLESDFTVMYYMDTMKRLPGMKTSKPFIKWATKAHNVLIEEKK